MSLHPFNTPLALKIKPSYQKWGLILFPPLFVCTLLISLDLFNFKFKLIIILLICFSTIYYLRLHIHHALKKSVRVIYQDSSKNWFIETIDTERKEVQLSNTSFFSQPLILINCTDFNNKKYTVLITPDSLSNAEHRRLIVRLKMSLL